jgi:hypothetical protein
MSKARAKLGWVVATAAALLLPSGCIRSGLQLTSYKDPYFPDTYHVALAECAYRADAGGRLHVIGRGTHQTEQGATTQYLCIDVFWQPKPGKTPADPTTTDALLRYVIANNAGVTVYTGTGFAYPETNRNGMTLALESGRLRLQSHSGDLGDVLGDAQITGQLQARNDPAAAATLSREAELLAARP